MSKLKTISSLFLVDAAGIRNNSTMASPEELIEPMVVNSAAQNLSRRRFSQDFYNLSPDEIDGLMSSSGKKKNRLNIRCNEWGSSVSKPFILLKQF